VTPPCTTFPAVSKDRPSRSTQEPESWRPDRCQRVALVLQGGGALGAYQAGAYQAMHEAGVEPDWVSGVSIGAINSAIIAGNPPKHRLRQLRAFWDMITERKIWPFTPDGDIFRKARNAHSCVVTSVAGQPGFFKPTFPNPWMSLTGASTATSYYDTSPLRETLLELVDFSLINERATRFSVGAVNVLTGNFVYFDNANEEIEPEHIMASGALPPALPMVKIGTDHFWDGGIVSNTLLQHLLDQEDKLNTLVFQVDLFSARGVLPRDTQEVLARQKDITYSSRTRYTTDVYRRIHNLKMLLAKALAKIPQDQLSDDDRRRLDELADLPEISILHIIYQQKAYEGARQGLRVFRHFNARALAKRLRRHAPDAEASEMAGDAAARFRRSRSRRSSPAGRLTAGKQTRIRRRLPGGAPIKPKGRESI
jgi:NTE family protein